MRIEFVNVLHPLIDSCAVYFVDSYLGCVLEIAKVRVSRPALRRVKELVLIVSVWVVLKVAKELTVIR